MKNRLKNIFSSILIAGVILLSIGVYLWFKAGLPYQDATIEMTIQWTAYHIAGDHAFKMGVVIGIIGKAGVHFFKEGDK